MDRLEQDTFRDDATGDFTPDRARAEPWGEFFELLRAKGVPEDFLTERPMNLPPTERGLFDDASSCSS